MKPQNYLTRSLMLPELNLIYTKVLSASSRLIIADIDKKGAVCPKCASLSMTFYDKRYVRVKDSPIHGRKTVGVSKDARSSKLCCFLIG